MSVRHKVGELRGSQLLHTYGVGSTVELPHLTVMVLGLGNWPKERSQLVSEPRLLSAVQSVFGAGVRELRVPPIEPEISRDDVDGVPVGVFPTWLRCPICKLLAPASSGLFTLEESPYRPDDARYVHAGCTMSTSRRKPTALAARYLLACERGHIDDFPWVIYVHRGPSDCKGTLRLSEWGEAGSGPADVQVSCDSCGANRRMSDAFGPDAAGELPRCRGRHPHLGIAAGSCPQTPKTMLLGATNAWFPVQMSALSIPSGDAPLEQAITEASALLEDVDSVKTLELVLKLRGADLPRVTAFIDELGAEHVVDTIVRLRDGAAPASEDLLTPEWALLSSTDGVHDLASELRVRSVEVPEVFAEDIARVVLVERLREVSALTGFTRIASPEGRRDYGEKGRIAPLAHGTPDWLLCSEVRGEGIFVQLPEERLAAWEDIYRSSSVWSTLLEGQAAWCQRRNIDPASMPTPEPRYVLIHSFAHALIRELALECGYNAASIRERIYARAADGMAGVLLYTAATDSEGTLGGLVGLGETTEFGPLLINAIDRLRICSSDPTCAEHNPAADGTMHLAACHACQFTAETSCEHGNRLLDRSVLVPTLTTLGDQSLAYFSPELAR